MTTRGTAGSHSSSSDTFNNNVNNINNNRLVTLTVGGEVFKTTVATLQAMPLTLLAELTNPQLPLSRVTCDRDSYWRNDRTKSASTQRATRMSPRTKGTCVGSEDSASLDQYTISTDDVDVTSTSTFSESCVDCHLSKSLFQGLSRARLRSSYVHVVDKLDDSMTSLQDLGDNLPVSPLPPQRLDLLNNHSQSRNRLKPHRPIKTHSSTPSSQSTPSKYSSQPPDDGSKISPGGVVPHPLSLLGCNGDLFFDRNPVLMPYILDVYRVGQLHLPTTLCSMAVREELWFWKIPEDMISECCWKTFKDGLNTMGVVESISASLNDPYDEETKRDSLNIRGKIWLTMERPSYSILAKLWAVIYFLMILMSALVYALQTVDSFTTIKPNFEEQYLESLDGNYSLHAVHKIAFFQSVMPLQVCAYIVKAFFTSEFFIRLFCCPEKSAFFCNYHNVLDMVCVLIVWVTWSVDLLITENTHHYNKGVGFVIVITQCLLAVVSLRVLHLAKHMRELKIMYLSMKASGRNLLLLVIMILSSSLLFGTVIFMLEAIESGSEDLPFSNIPIAMWWAIVTMTTVGYGDYFPLTTSGRIMGAACAISGLLLVALPIAVIASNYSSFYINLTSHDHRMRRQRLIERIKTFFLSGDGSADIGGKELEDHSTKGDQLLDSLSPQTRHPRPNGVLNTMVGREGEEEDSLSVSFRDIASSGDAPRDRGSATLAVIGGKSPRKQMASENDYVDDVIAEESVATVVAAGSFQLLPRSTDNPEPGTEAVTNGVWSTSNCVLRVHPEEVYSRHDTDSVSSWKSSRPDDHRSGNVASDDPLSPAFKISRPRLFRASARNRVLPN